MAPSAEHHAMNGRPKTRQDRDCCTVNFLRYILFIYNVFFLISGLGVLGVAIWTIAEKHTYITLLTSSTYAVTSYLLLLAGLIVIISAVIGCSAVSKKDRFGLMMYTFLLLLIFLMEAVGGIMAYIYEEQIMGELSHSLTDTFSTRYSVDDAATRAIDTMQTEYHCCGPIIFSQWKDSTWKRDKLNGNNTVPDSCCRTPSTYCGVRDHPSNVWYTGCIHKFEEELGRHLLILGAVGCGISFIQILGIIISCYLYIKLKDTDDDKW